MKILLIGAKGQLGTDLLKTNPGYQVIGLTQKDLDITDQHKVFETIRRYKPRVVINTAAFNRTEDCEVNPQKAFMVNAMGPQHLAQACLEIGARLIHFSTDYVFDGKKGTPYIESDSPNPLSVYGLSKLGGECLSLAVSENNLVLRGSSLFGVAGSSGKGGNFVEAIIKRSQEGLPVEVVDDVVMSPTYTRDQAQLTWTLLKENIPGGIYHAANTGFCSWYELTKVIFSLLGFATSPKAISSDDRPSKIKRPHYSVLTSERLSQLKIKPLRGWQEAIQAYLVEKGHLSK